MTLTKGQLRELLHEMFMRGCRLGLGYNPETLESCFEIHYKNLTEKEKDNGYD